MKTTLHLIGKMRAPKVLLIKKTNVPILILLSIPILFFCFMFAAKAQEYPVQRTPVAKAVTEISKSKGLVIGELLPVDFWNVELNVVIHPDGLTKVKLSDYKDKLLVLDFWATYCSPCVRSVDHWNDLLKEFSTDVEVLAIHKAAANERALPLAEKKGWSLPITINNEIDVSLSKLFFAKDRFGQVWIKDGKLLAIPKNSSVSVELINKALKNRPLDIEMEDYRTYFDHRNNSDDQSLNLKE